MFLVSSKKKKVLAFRFTEKLHVALFKIARTWKQPKCLSAEEWIKKMWYKYTMEYYSAIKRNKNGSYVEMWMDLETVIQSEVKSEREKQILYIITYI